MTDQGEVSMTPGEVEMGLSHLIVPVEMEVLMDGKELLQKRGERGPNSI
jgi:hypothetical protein